MFEQTNGELAAFEAKLNALRMYGSERFVAMTALRNGFVIVECATWAAQKIRQLPAVRVGGAPVARGF